MASLQELDSLFAEVAGLVYRTVPVPAWRSATLHAKYTPDGLVSGHDFDYQLDNGEIDQGTIPPLAAIREIKASTRKHWEASTPRWYALHLTVTQEGKMQAEWEYVDEYTEGDILRRG